MELLRTLETEHLILRKAKPGDLEAIYKNVWSDESLAKYMLWTPANSLAEAKERLEKTIDFQSKNNVFFVCLKESDEAIGFAGVMPNTDEPGVYNDCGICIAAKFHGKGYGKEVVKALARLIFEELQGTKFHYSCFKENTRSAALCESLGFKYLGIAKKFRKRDNLEYDSKEFELNKK